MLNNFPYTFMVIAPSPLPLYLIKGFTGMLYLCMGGVGERTVSRRQLQRENQEVGNVSLGLGSLGLFCQKLSLLLSTYHIKGSRC